MVHIQYVAGRYMVLDGKQVKWQWSSGVIIYTIKLTKLSQKDIYCTVKQEVGKKAKKSK